MTSAVTADRLGKTYKVYARPLDRLIEAAARRPRHRAFQALHDVSFALEPGEALGIIGENGAGKSTLLKILTGITPPTTGRFDVHGNVAAILELGAGFHPEFTGRQNIALNAALLGLDQARIDETMPSIIAFSELEAFIDQPVKCYSTGMAMRLAFAIAIQVRPDVLIVDEALSVGDGYFQKKCIDALRTYLGQGGTLLFCSHAMYYVSAFCKRALWLRDGRVEALGPIDRVVQAYEGFLAAKSRAHTEQGESEVPEPPDQVEPKRARLLDVRVGPVAATREDDSVAVACGGPWQVEIALETDSPERPLHLGVAFNRASDDIEVCAFGTHVDQLPPLEGRRDYRVTLEIPELHLVKGAFTLYVYLVDEAGLHVYDQRILPAAFEVESRRYHFGIVTMPHRWETAAAPTVPPSERQGMEIEV